MSRVAARPHNLLLITLRHHAGRSPARVRIHRRRDPALDRIAAEGRVFEEAFAAVPLTLPSHASLFTGLYPPRLGVRDNASPPLALEFTTLAEALRARRLRTAAFIASAVLAPQRGLEQGFDLYSAGDSARCPGGAPRRRAEAVVAEALFGWAPLRSLRADRYKLRHSQGRALRPGERSGRRAECAGGASTVAAAMLRRLRSLDSAPEPTPSAETDNATLERIRSLGARAAGLMGKIGQ